MSFTVKRIYDPPARIDGTRVLVDRLWPRGLTKGKAHVDGWLKEIGPSTALRKWFGHDPARWAEFKRRYHVELRANKQVVSHLRRFGRKGQVTLLFGAKDTAHNQAVALLSFLRKR